MVTKPIIPGDILEKIEEIRRDNVNSSIILTRKSVNIILDFIEIIEEPSIQELKEVILKLVDAQPMMASIFNFCNTLLIELEKHRDSIKSFIINYSNEFIDNLDNQIKRISKHILPLIDDDMIIATYSYSSTVAEVLNYANKKDKSFTVICSESRPVNEGISLAKYLGENGIKTILTTDATLFSNINKADIVFVGADSVGKDGIVNKIGTSVLARITHRESIPFYHLCGIEKILPYDYPIIKERFRDPSEILKKPIDNVIVRNQYFDTTPIDYVTGIITEIGVLSKEKLMDMIESYRIHHEISRYLSSRN